MAQLISPARSQWTEPEVAGAARLPVPVYLEETARSGRNLFLYSGQYEHTVWSTGSPWTYATADDDATDDPAGNPNSAAIITHSGTNASAKGQLITVLPNTTYVVKARVRHRSGSTPLTLEILDPDNGYASIVPGLTVNLTGAYQDMVLVGTTGPTQTRAFIGLVNSFTIPQDYDLYGFQVHTGTVPDAYTETGATAVTTQVVEFAVTDDASAADAIAEPIAGGGLVVSDDLSATAAVLSTLGVDVSASYTKLPALPDAADFGTLLWRLRSAEIAALADGAAIDPWPGWNGLPNGTQPTLATRPTKQTVNGRAVARFAGSHLLEMLVQWPHVSTFYVKYANRGAHPSGIASCMLAPGNYGAVTEAPLIWRDYIAPSDGIVGQDPGDGSRLILPWNYTTESYPVYVDGVNTITLPGPATINAAYAGITIGRSYNQWLTADILEIGMYDGILLPATVADLDAYLVATYGA